MKRYLLRLTNVLLLTLILTGCNNMGRFNEDAIEIQPDELGYTLISNQYITTDNDKIVITQIIIDALKAMDQKLSKIGRVEHLYVSGHNIHFLFKIKTSQENGNYFHHYAQGYMDIHSSKVHISDTLKTQNELNYLSFNVIGGTHALIQTNTSVKFVFIDTYEVIQEFDKTNLIDDKELTNGITKYNQGVLTRYVFSSSGIEEEVYDHIPDYKYFAIIDNVLLSSYDQYAYDIILKESVDYQTYRDLYTSFDRHVDYNDYLQTLTLFDETYQLDDFMGLTDTLKAFQRLLDKHEIMFNYFYILESNEETYLIAQYSGSGLLFLTSQSDYYAFKMTEDSFIYVGSNPEQIISILEPHNI